MGSFSTNFEAVNAVAWSITSVALVLTGGRFYIRWRLLNGLHWDDIAHLFATLFMLSQICLYQYTMPILQESLLYMEDPKAYPEPDVETILSTSNAADLILTFGLWAVKLAYMLLYRQIFKRSEHFKLIWWSVMAFDVATLVVAIFSFLSFCGGSPEYLTNWKVCQDPKYTPVVKDLYVVSYVAIVSSDLATMLPPLAMMRGLQIRRSQKLAICGILCLSFFTIGMETLRLAESMPDPHVINFVWQYLELEVAVIVSALPAYYSLINWHKARRASTRSYTSSPSSNAPLRAKEFMSSDSSTQSLSSTPPNRSSWERWDQITKTQEFRLETGMDMV